MMTPALLGQSIVQIKVAHSKLMLAQDTNFLFGESTHGSEGLNQKVNVLFLEGHVKMHDYPADFDRVNTDPSKPVYLQITR